VSNLKTINLPDYGDFDEVEVIEICVESGQEVDSEEPILILETDKAAMEIPSSVNGTVNKVILNVGDKVKVGMPFLEIEVQENKEVDKTNIDIKEEVSVDEKTFMDDPPSAVDDAANVMSKQESNVINLNNHKSKNIHSGPATRKLAREFGINLSSVAGSGPKGRILKEDLHQYVKNILSSRQEQTFKSTQPDIDFSEWGNTKEVDLTKFQKTSLDNLHSSWVNIPHVTQHEEINISKLMKIREKLCKKYKLKISPLAFILKGLSVSLKEYEMMNSSLSKDLNTIIFKDFINIGVAVDTEYGLIVPNIKNIDSKNISNIASEVKELADLAKKRRLKNEHLQGASFTVSSLSGVGGKFFTPIINPPEVGILGLSRTFDSLKLDKLKLETVKMLPVSLSYDHRVINGVYAIQFINHLSEVLNDIKFLEDSFK